MKTAMPTLGFKDCGIPTKVASRHLKPMPETIESSGEKQHFRVLESMDHLPIPAPLSEKLPPVLEMDRMVVSASLIRRIEYEMKHDGCDPRPVFNACRGMTRGSVEFENAYTAARIRCHAKQQRVVTDPLPGAAPNADIPLPSIGPNNPLKPKAPPPQHPLAVNHPGDLMSHLGIWVIALLGTQAWASWRISALASGYLEGGRFFHFAIALLLCLALDSGVWFCRRGRLFDAFFVPGVVLFLMALLPILILHA